MARSPVFTFVNDVPPADVRGRILAAAARLLAEGGREALTTRAVATSAGVQQPTLYRLFGDKTGLLDAVGEHGLTAYVATKAALAPSPDPLADFREGWDRHVGFGLTHPALFVIIWCDPNPARVSPAAEAGRVVLRRKVHALAEAGLLRVSEERAVDLTHATCTGAVLVLLSAPEHARDAGLTTAAREAVVTAITHTIPAMDRPGPAGAAIALRALLDQVPMLSSGERHLLGELLDRIAARAQA